MIRSILVAFFVLLSTAGASTADVLTFDKVKFRGEQNGDRYGGKSWTQLGFEILSPKINGKNYLKRRAIRFTIDADRGPYRRTDIRFQDDWLQSRASWLSSKSRDMYIGSKKLNGKQKSDVLNLTAEERVVGAWIIANSSELIQFALSSNMPIAWSSIIEWKKLLRNRTFESNVRANLGPYFSKQLEQYKKYSRPTAFKLKRQIQPRLSTLGFYDGNVDGKFGPATLNAIQKFESSKGRFPDGILDETEMQLIKDAASDYAFYNDIDAVKKREENLRTQLVQFQQRLKSLSLENSDLIAELKKTQTLSELRYTELITLRKQVTDVNKRQKNISPELSRKIFSLEKNLKAAEAKLSKLKNEIQGQNATIDQMADNNIGLRNSNKSLKTKLDELSNITARLRAEVEKKEVEAAGIAKHLAKIRQNTASKTELAEVKDKLTGAMIVVGNLSKDKDHLSGEIKSKSEEIQTLNNKFYTVNTENESLKNSNINLQSKLLKKSASFDVLANENAGLKKSLDQVAVQAGLLADQLEAAKAKIENLKKGNNGGSKVSEAFTLGAEWNDLKQWITPQQIRFCSILVEYEVRKVAARESGNQLKQNLAILQRDEDIDALLLGRSKGESGYFRNWIGTVESVFAIQQKNPNSNQLELAAGVVIKTPCSGVTVGSGKIVSESTSEEQYAAVAFQNDPIYMQLAQVSKGDPIIFDGSLLTYSAGISGKPPKFITNIDGSNPSIHSQEGNLSKNTPDYFVSVEYLSKL